MVWHSLLPGRNMPGIHPDMPTAGKTTATES
jgi:hypothetical protein